MKRCAWAEANDLERAYHDTEWGVPIQDDQQLFAMLCLEGAQAGLSWDTVLKKREGYHAVFNGFDIKKCAELSDSELEGARGDTRIVRNRLKIASVRRNARASLEIIKDHGSLGTFIWSFVDGAPVQNQWRCAADVPVRTAVSDAMSKALASYGMSFVGSTICYAFMQSTGMVNDHETDCFRYRAIKDIDMSEVKVPPKRREL